MIQRQQRPAPSGAVPTATISPTAYHHGAAMTPRANTAVARGEHLEFSVLEWKFYAKDTLVGFLSPELPSGRILNHCSLQTRGDSRWIRLPARQYTKDNGSTSWITVLEFTSRERCNKFQQVAIAAVDQRLDGAR